ncbi:MAG TPA: DNA recombination protein RmuC, partial [Candidatus Saccharimonadales bacterium]|nr:DNA recombination protein RmuC [Candidatus Saccharimonadales bacterium]
GMEYNKSMLIVVIILGVLVLGLLGAVLWQLRRPRTDPNASLLLKADITELNKSMGELKDGLQKQLTEQMGRSNKQMAQQFQASAKIIADVTQKLTELDKTNKNVGDIASELKTLQNVLQNPKQRGVIGEYYLKQILENVLPTGTFELQYRLGEGLVVDAVIKLDDRLLPLDSKFSLENYNRLLEAPESEKDMLTRAFKEDVKKRIDETAKYIKPGKGTLDQALMFIPSEAIYYDLLANKVGVGNVSGRNLMQYAIEKKVTIVGPSTLSAMLQTIAQGLRSIEIHKDTEKIRKNIEQLSKHLIAHNAYMQKLGNSLGTTVGHFNNTYKELGKIDRDIVKITDTAPNVEPQLLDKPQLED